MVRLVASVRVAVGASVLTRTPMGAHSVESAERIAATAREVVAASEEEPQATARADRIVSDHLST
jgi:hypothetical protein